MAYSPEIFDGSNAIAVKRCGYEQFNTTIYRELLAPHQFVAYQIYSRRRAHAKRDAAGKQCFRGNASEPNDKAVLHYCWSHADRCRAN
jgi:hypothetical protein